MMDERNERRVKRSVILGFNTLSKKRAKNYITKAVKKRLYTNDYMNYYYYC